MVFENFHTQTMTLDEVTIHYRIGGKGPPLLLLHGCPQSHLMWHKLVPVLSREFTIVASDLRGYGDSSKPQGLPDHANYSFRAMAADQNELMARLGYASFSAIGHDRGARVLHRMALDFPGRLQRLAFLDILPTTVLYEQTDRHFATSYWEWFFFTQGRGFPEKLLSADPESFLRYELGHLADNGTIAPEIWHEYLRVLQGQASMHGMCEDYRAGATIDLAHDATDAGRRIEAPLLLLWGAHNPVWKRFDMIATWQRFAGSVVGRPIPAGHYLAEEAPDRVLAELLPFMRAQS